MVPYLGDSSRNNFQVSTPRDRNEDRRNLEMWPVALLPRASQINHFGLGQIHLLTQPALPRLVTEINSGLGQTHLPTQPELPRCAFKTNLGSPTQPDNSAAFKKDDSAASKRDKVTRVKRTRGTGWTKDEHRLFLRGLRRFGKGNWKKIARCCVVSKTSTQVASHAQKYHLHQDSRQLKKRTSIHDMTLKDDDIVDHHYQPNERTSIHYMTLKDDDVTDDHTPNQSHNELIGLIPRVDQHNPDVTDDATPHIDQHGPNVAVIPHWPLTRCCCGRSLDYH